MILKVLGSSSAGNTYILENDDEALILDAGISFMEVKKALNFNISKISGVCVTHIHGDHAKYADDYKKAGIPIYKPYEREYREWIVGKFHVWNFEQVHDVPCFGFLINHPDIGNLLYATDTEYIKYTFKSLSHMLIEANYSELIIEREAVNREHVLRGHMSLETTLKAIQANDNPSLKNVVLIHLSDRNSNEREFLQRTKEVLKSDSVNVSIANKGLTIDLG